MIRKIIEIDQNKCDGCGICAEACHEGAIGIVDGKAKLLRDDYCDGLGNCLPACPQGAISFVEREAAAYDEAAVQENMARKAEMKQETEMPKLACGCPGHSVKSFAPPVETPAEAHAAPTKSHSQLRQWPVQIKLAPVNASFFKGAKLLVAADCTAYAYANMHEDFIKGHVTLIGCPKLDEGDYAEKLTAILTQNEIRSLTVLRMEVPCCGGIVNAVKSALQKSGKLIPWQVHTISCDGRLLED